MSINLKSKKFQDTVFQVGFVGFLVVLIITLVTTTISNLEAQGITSGFGFLSRATGWDVNFSMIPFSPSDTYGRVLAIGFMNSTLVGLISLVLASVLGTLVGVLRTSGNGMGEIVGATFVEVFRNVPLLLQLFFWYAILLSLPKPRESELIWGGFAFTGRGIYLPSLNVDVVMGFVALLALLIGFVASVWIRKSRRTMMMDQSRRNSLSWAVLGSAVVVFLVLIILGRVDGTLLLEIPALKGLNYRGGLRIGPELLTCIVAISVYGAAYVAEVIRAGLNAVNKMQAEAGHALGLSNWQTFSRIRLPLAIRIIMPILINQYVWLMKATTVGIAVGFTDFFFVILTSINQSGQTIELIGILMAGFLLLNYTLAWAMNRVNDAIKLKGTQLRT